MNPKGERCKMNLHDRLPPSIVFAAMSNDGNTSQIKVEKEEDDENTIACNGAEENEFDCKTSINALCDTINEGKCFWLQDGHLCK